eukprot:1585286-Pleurochrysis_carterae.AAC.1
MISEEASLSKQRLVMVLRDQLLVIESNLLGNIFKASLFGRETKAAIKFLACLALILLGHGG